MKAPNSFTIVCNDLIGLPIGHVWRGHGSAVFLEIGALTPFVRKDGSPGNPEGEIGLGVEWSWRIEADRSIICGSWSDEVHWQPAFDLLQNGRVTSCELFGVLPEVAVTTDKGVRFISFSTTEGQPQWSLVDRRNGLIKWFSVREGQLHLGDGSE